MTKVEFEHATVDASEPVRMGYERKPPEPVAWMLNGEFYAVQQCRFFSKSPGEVKPGQVPLFTEAQLREALASHEAVMQHVLGLIGPQAPECCGCAAEWNEAIKALEEALLKTVFTTGEPAPVGFYQGAIADIVRNGDKQ